MRILCSLTRGTGVVPMCLENDLQNEVEAYVEVAGTELLSIVSAAHALDGRWIVLDGCLFLGIPGDSFSLHLNSS